jgi:hypothetical protein
MVCAYVTTNYVLAYHGSSNHFQWTMTLTENGSSGGGGANKFLFQK